MSQAHHDEPLRWHWLYIPLVAFLAFVFVPSVLVPIIFVLSLVVDITGIAVPVQRPQRLLSIFIDPFFIGLALWPFLRLYRYARNALIEHPSSEASLRLATIMSTVAMSLPCPLLSLETIGAMMSSARDAYQGWGIIVIYFIILLPLLGILGWLIGRGIAWMLRPCPSTCNWRYAAIASAVAEEISSKPLELTDDLLAKRMEEKIPEDKRIEVVQSVVIEPNTVPGDKSKFQIRAKVFPNPPVAGMPGFNIQSAFPVAIDAYGKPVT